jgi:hypothetical protein
LGWGCVVGMGSHVYNIVPVDNPLANHAAVLFPEVRFHWVYSIFLQGCGEHCDEFVVFGNHSIFVVVVLLTQLVVTQRIEMVKSGLIHLSGCPGSEVFSQCLF